jgi:hypothetical protein
MKLLLRNVAFISVWISIILLLLFPSSCSIELICSKSAVPLVIALGLIGAFLALLDSVKIKNDAKKKLFGEADRESKE